MLVLPAGLTVAMLAMDGITAETENGRSPNDGLGMLASLLMQREEIARQVREAAAGDDEDA